MFKRLVNLPEALSYFLFGARQTGKTTIVSSVLPAETLTFNFLNSRLYERFLPDPSRFSNEVREALARRPDIKVIFVDEVQRLPAILNEVQLLMDEAKLQFILTGSSARKLKRGAANLLGGRALERHLFPLTWAELGRPTTIDSILQFGSLPRIAATAADSDRVDLLQAYSSIYLREEIQAEGLVRNLPGFARFMDVAAFQSGQLANLSAIAREAGVAERTVHSYFEILEDTLIATRLDPYMHSPRKRLLKRSKYYFFDIGVRNALLGSLFGKPDATLTGLLFEHFIVLDTIRMLSYRGKGGRLSYWQTSGGAEVDLVVEEAGELVAGVEIKTSGTVVSAQLKGLRSFAASHPRCMTFVVSLVAPAAYRVEKTLVLPFAQYLDAVEAGALTEL